MSEQTVRTGGMLSIIAPAMNENDNIPRLCSEIKRIFTAEGIPYELIIVDDGSSDNTWLQVLAQAETDPAVRGITFSRNFGKESAMSAGLAEAQGACAAIIDADLQFPPETLVKMYRLWESDSCDIAEGRKQQRQKETLTYKLFSKTFYKMLKAMSGVDLDNMCDFKLMDRRIVDVLVSLPERQTFFRALSDWPGFRKGIVPFEVAERSSGSSKFTPVRLIKLALGAISSFSGAPLQFVTGAGVFSLVTAVLLALFTLIYPFEQAGVSLFCWGAVLLALFSGLIMIALGIVGYYLTRMYEELKGRPKYIIAGRTDTNRKDR